MFPILLVTCNEKVENREGLHELSDQVFKTHKVACKVYVESLRSNLLFSKGYGHCKYEHNRIFEYLLVSSYLVFFSDHQTADNTKEAAQFSQLTGARRNRVIELVKTHGGRVAHELCQEGLDNSLCEKGNTQHLAKLSTFQKLASTIRTEKCPVSCECIRLMLYAQNREWESLGDQWFKSAKPEQFCTVSFFRHGFQVFLFQEACIKAFKKIPLQSIVVHLDATGSLVRPIKCHDLRLSNVYLIT